MKTELFLYKPNVLKNWNFNEANTTIDNDGVTLINYWETNGLWSLTGGQAVCINSDGALLEQKGLTPNTQYTLKVNVASISGTALVLNVGPTLAAFIISPGIAEISINTGIYDSISFAMSIGDDVTLNWVTLIEEPNVCLIDNIDDISIPITYSIADIRDISTRNGSFTRTILIPGTTNNNKIFNHIFEIDGDCNYNPNKKVKAVLIHDGEEQLSGYLQIKNINRSQNGLSNYNLVSYEVVIIGGVTNLFAEMGTTLISDLGYSEYTHTYTANNQELTWNGGITKNGVYTPNWINGFSQSIDSVQAYGDGRVQMNFSSPHGFLVNDQVYINISDITSIAYNGDQRVFEVPSTTSIVLFFPYISGTGVLTGANFAFKHEPTGDGYIYPMIYNGTHIDETVMDGVNWKVTDFLPSIYLKTYLNKIEERFGYTFVSNLFDSVDFKRLIMTPTDKSFKPNNTELNDRAFQAERTTGGTGGSYDLIPINYDPSVPGSSIGGDYWDHDGSPVSRNITMIFDNDSTGINFDNDNTYDNTTGVWTPTVSGTYKLSANIKFAQQMNFPALHLPESILTTDNKSKWTITIHDYTAGTIVAQTQYGFHIQILADRTFGPIIKSCVSNSFYGIAGHNYGVEVTVTDIAQVFVYCSPSTTPTAIHVDWQLDSYATFFNEPVATTYTDGEIINLVAAIPKMTCKEFLINLIKMFNLYIEPDKDNDKILYVLPRSEYYDYNVSVNWTEKLDLDNTILLQPMAELSAKEYQYVFKNDNAALNQAHFSASSYGYGDKIIKVDNDFLTTTTKTELTVSSGVLIEFPIGSGRIITGIYGLDNGAKSRIDANPRILYFSLTSSAPNTWNHTSSLSGQTISNKLVYPYAGHLDKVRGPKFDFNFGYPDTNDFVTNQWTSMNLYNLYYRDMIGELTSKNNKLITAYLYLNNSDISKLNFRNQYFIDGYYLRLNKVIDYVPGTSESTKCEFTKIETAFNFVPSFMRTNAVGPGYGQDTLDGDILPIVNPDLKADSFSNPTIKNNGFRNNISTLGSTKILVNGSDNTIGQYSTNITLIDSDNVVVLGGLNNITVINTSNIVITQSNVTIINGITINGNGTMINNNINFISAGVDEVLNPFNNITTVNLINAGKDNVLGIGGINTINNINAGKDSIL